MTGQSRGFGGFVARTALGLAATAAAVALWAPTAAATPESDAADAIAAAWDAAGGDASQLGARQGDVYPIGEGFAENFAGGKMFYTPATGARAMYGPVLEKYESLGGPVDSDLGFPNVDEGVGRASPDSRSVTFSAGDNPVIFYTPEHGAFLVRGAMNAAWDKLGSSSGALGVPVADETADGDVVSQKFSGGDVSWNRGTQAFSTVPAELSEQLKNLQIPVDATAAINRAWRSAGGAGGPLGAKNGEQYAVGTDGAGQDFEHGKILFSAATGAASIDGDVLAKYESLGGPAGSDLGFPVGNEADGPIAGSRVSTFSGADKPVIFFSPEHGAFVVRGAMKAAWDKLGGATGALGAPVGDQTVDGNVVSQKFGGGQTSWDRVANRFSTEPPKLAAALAGLQVPGQDTPSASATGQHAGAGFGWHWWWLAIVLGVLLVLAVLAGWWRRRQRKAEQLLMRRNNGRRRVAVRADVNEAAPVTDYDDEDSRWLAEPDEPGRTVRLPNLTSRYGESAGETESLDQPESDDGWMPGGGTVAGLGVGGYAEAHDDASAPGDHGAAFDDDPDAVDTAPTRIPAVAEVHGGRHSVTDTDTDTDADAVPAPPERNAAAYPAFHLPLDDPYQSPEGYPVKANTVSGLYYTPDSPLYADTLAEVWFASEDVAQFNGFIRAD